MKAPTPTEPVLLAWSGGKDSYLALQALRRDPAFNVRGLLTTLTSEYDRISMHGVRRALLLEQAAATGLPLNIVEIPPGSDNRTYEDRMAPAVEGARANGIQKVAFGDLYLEEIRAYRERMLAQVGMTAIFPLWGAPTDALARRFIAEGHRAILVCVDTSQIPAELAGRDYDLELLADLPATADPCGENGEFHTFVHAGDLLSQTIEVSRGEQVTRDERFVFQDLLRRSD